MRPNLTILVIIFFHNFLFSQTVDYCNLQSPASASISQFDEVAVYSQVYEAGVTDVNNTASTNISAWIGVSTTNTDPSTWAESAWTSAPPNGSWDFTQNNDEHTVNIGSDLNPGTYYYASRYQIDGGTYSYGGYDSGGGDGFWDGTNDVSGVLTVSAPDDCANAVELTFTDDETDLVQVDDALLTASGVSPACENGTPEDAWYSFTMPFDGNVVVTNLNTFTEVAIYDDCTNLTSLSCGLSNTFTYNLVEGQTYYVQAYKASTSTGLIQFKISAYEPPTNNDCATATSIDLNSGNSYSQSFLVESNGATPSGISPTCEPGNPEDLWFSFEMPFDGNIVFTTVISSFTEIQFYKGTCGSLEALSCGSDKLVGYDNSPYASLESGVTYYIQVYKMSNLIGPVNFSLTAWEHDGPVDHCATATEITLDETTNYFSSVISQQTNGSLPSGISPVCENGEPEDVWYSFTMPFDGNAAISNLNSFTEVAFYDDCTGSNSLGCTGNSFYAEGLQENETYYIQAYRVSNTLGAVQFRLNVTESIENDECLTAEELVFDEDNESLNQFSIDGATISASSPSCRNNTRDAWFKMTSPINGTYAIQGFSYSEFAVYESDETNCVGAELDCFLGNGTFNVVQGEEYIIRAWKALYTGSVQMNLIPTAIPVSEASSGACVGSPTIPSVTIDSSNNDEWVNILDDDGDVVAAIHANGNNLGAVATELLIDNNDYFTYSPGGDDPDIYYMKRVITITPTVQPTSGAVSVRLYFELADEFYPLLAQDDDMLTINDLGLVKVPSQACGTTYNGEDFEVLEPVITTYTPLERSVEFEVTSFSKFLFMSNEAIDILPVKLASFTAEKHGESSLLKWTTASESNNDGFTVQHSNDGIQWQNIAWVQGAGNSSSPLDYQYLHGNPSNGMNFYRLEQVDFDGSHDYSDVVELEFEFASKLMVYPNPSTDQVQLQIPQKFIGARVEIIDVSGSTLMVIENVESNTMIPVSQLPKAVYSLRITNGAESESTIFLKQ